MCVLQYNSTKFIDLFALDWALTISFRKWIMMKILFLSPYIFMTPPDSHLTKWNTMSDIKYARLSTYLLFPLRTVGQRTEIPPQKSISLSHKAFVPNIFICQYVHTAHMYLSWKNRCDGYNVSLERLPFQSIEPSLSLSLSFSLSHSQTHT